MKKTAIYFITVVLALVNSNSESFAQNIEFEKKLDNTVQLDEYVNHRQNYIRYYKVLDDKILRVENLKLQLFDYKFDKIWEIELERLDSKKAILDYDNIYVNSDNNDIFLIQLTYIEKLTAGSKLRLIKIGKNGKLLSKEIKYKSTRFYNIDVSKNRVFIHFLEPGKVQLASVLTTPRILVFDKELNFLQEIELPQTTENSEVVPKWIYNKFEDNEFYYECYYYKKDGKISIDKRKEAIMKKREIIVNEKGILFDSTSVISEKIKIQYYSSNQFFYYPLMFDNSVYLIYFNKVLLSNVRRGFIMSANVKIIKDNYEINLNQEISNFNSKFNGELIGVEDIVHDPINNNIIFIITGTYPNRYLITFNDKLEIAYMQKIKVLTDSKKTTGNLSLAISKLKKSFGQYPEGHVMNALDYAVKLDGKPFITILNYSNYQLLFTDNKDTGESKVYKFIK